MAPLPFAQFVAQNTSLTAQQQQRLLNAWCRQYGWTEESSLTQVQFFNQMLTRSIRETVRAYESGQAAQDAQTAKAAEVDIEFGELA